MTYVVVRLSCGALALVADFQPCGNRPPTVECACGGRHTYELLESFGSECPGCHDVGPHWFDCARA